MKQETLPTRMDVLCDSSCFKKIHDFVRAHATEFGLNRTDIGRFVLAADEICSNIVKHTYRFEPNHKIVLTWQNRGESAVLEVEDDSPVPYLPGPTDFDVHTKMKYRHSGGYGKYLVRQAIDDVQYETVPGSHNKVSLLKFKDGHSPAGKKEVISNPYDLARARSLSLMMLFEVEENLGHQESVEEILKVFLYAVMGRLTTQPVVLLAPKNEESPFTIVGQIGLSKKIESIGLALPRHGWVIETLWAQRGPFLVEQFRKLRIPKEEIEALDRLQAAVLIPLFIFNQLRGILALGSKRSGSSFSEEDINLV
ncbi:MAG: ATP-binding protein, partial [bacterium]|nr:ATP-binding protein [bacterium]